MSFTKAAPRNRGGIGGVLQVATIAVALAVGPGRGGHRDGQRSVWMGRAFLILSGVIALAGFVALGRNLTPNPKPRDNATLVSRGIYALVRHPLYCSLVLGCLGWGLMWRSGPAVGAAVFLAWALDAKARVEERWLRERFPEYGDYARRVRRFIPWIY